MLYDNYQKRIQKLAAVLSRIIKLLPLIITVFSLIIIATVTWLACIGMASEVTFASEIEYGEKYEFSAEAFMSDVRIEYSREGSDEWSDTKPYLPGNYSVRAVGKTIFDKDRYGKVGNFVIIPRSVDVRVKEGNIIYGESPTVISQTVYNDVFFCDEVVFDDISAEKTGVTPVLSRIKFTDSNGNDVTYAYDFNILTTDISFDKRELAVTVGSASKEYDNTPLSLEAYEISSGTLAYSDSLGAIFNSSLTDVGTVDNIPEFKILHEDNGKIVDITNQYKITVTVGKLTVTKKVVTFITGSLEGQYSGEEFYCDKFELDPSSSLIEGHTASLSSYQSVTDCGEHKNSQVIKITDKDGTDKTNNYAIYYNEGIISISPKPISVVTGSNSWVYDGVFHNCTDFSVEGLIEGHTAKVKASTEMIKFVGTAENRFEIAITDEKGKDKSFNYDVSYEYGSLEITPRPITIRTRNGTWMYDGLAHTAANCTITSPLVLASGDSISITSPTRITDVGTLTNKFEAVKIIGNGGVDNTYCYEIELVYGLLEITPRPLWVRPENTEKVYDSTPLYGGEIKVVEGPSSYPLVQNHVMEATPDGSRTIVGTSYSTVKTINIYDGDRDVTKNYKINKMVGEITITPRKIILLTSSAEKDYDGKALTDKKFSVPSHSPYQLVVGHKVTMTITGSQTKIGESQNTLNETKTRITSSSGSDVTSNYEISYELGILKVNPYARITILSASDVKFYDGTPLKNPNVDVSIDYGKLRSGHQINIDVTGSITDPGSAPNSATATVVDKYGKDVSSYYEITVVPGTLKVVDPEKAETPDDTIFGRIETSEGGTVYLRMQSYGNYTGREWTGAVPYGKTLPGGYSYNYLTSIALRNSGAAEKSAHITDSILYMLPYYMGFNGYGAYDMPKSDTVYLSDLNDYALSYYSITNSRNGYEALKGKLGEYAEYEEEYRKFVYKNYTKVDDKTRAYMEGLIAENMFSLSDPNVIQKVATYVQHAAIYNLDYDPKLDMEENVVIAFLDEYKEGKCVHYASAATLLFRTLGIPARYVTGFMIQTAAGKFVDITNPGHAWVEVYIDGVGWIEVEVTGSDGSGGAGEGEGGEGGAGGGAGGGYGGLNLIELTPKYQYKVFDGKPLEAVDELDITGKLAVLLKRGYSYSVSVTGSQTKVGIGTSTIESFKLLDPNGKDVTDSFKYVYNEGVLEVFHKSKSIIVVSLYEIQKYYDGTPLRFEEGDFEIVSDTKGLQVDLDITASIVEAGEVTLSQLNAGRDKYAVFNVYQNGKNVTSDYTVIFQAYEGAPNPYVPLRVDPRIISLTSATETKIEDGTPLTNEKVTISKGSLLAGHTMEAYAIGYIDSPGTVDNFIDLDNIIIKDKDGNDVTFNYVFKHCVAGTLTIISIKD